MPVGSGQEEQSAFELHELGQEPPPELLLPAGELPPDEAPGALLDTLPELLMSPTCEEAAGPAALLTPTEPPASSGG